MNKEVVLIFIAFIILKKQNMPSALKSCDPDHVLKLAMDVIPQNSCLIFCPTKKNCESVALMLAKFMPRCDN